jgi:hypothetical protein
MQLELNWIELIEAKSESHCSPNHVFDPWETKTTLVNRFDAKILYNLSSSVDVFGEFHILATKSKAVATGTKTFFGQKMAHCCHIVRNVSLNSPYLHSRF